MNLILFVLINLLNLYLWLIIANVLVSWLVVFGVLNTRNRWVDKACALLFRVTSPGMDYLRRVVPPVGGIDLTPMVMMFLIYIAQGLLFSLYRYS